MKTEVICRYPMIILGPGRITRPLHVREEVT
jgi:hypothetical protein